MIGRMLFRHNIVSLRCARFSTRSSQDYLRQWLGNDMSGETYHSRIMAAAKARYESGLQQQQQHQQQNPQDGASVNSTENGVARDSIGSRASIAFPVVVLPPPFSDTKEALEFELFLRDALNDVDEDDKFCVLDLTHIDSSSSAVEETVERVIASSTSDCNVIGAVNYRGEGRFFCGLPIFRDVGNPSHSLQTEQQQQQQQQQQQDMRITEKRKQNHEHEKKSASNMPIAPSRAHVHYGTVRSGQQVYAEKASLIVIGGVNDGGEVLADGDIHVYGQLKGRAVAGLGGGPDGANACVFARSFGPSLVGVNEVFIAPDDHAAAKQFLEKEVVVRASGAKNMSTGVGARLHSVDIDGVTISLLPLS